MIKYFRKKKFKKDVVFFQNKLLESLASRFPDLVENHSHYELSLAMIVGTNEKCIQLLYQTDDKEYWQKNKIRHNKNFKITDINIYNVKDASYQSFTLNIYGNIIQHILLPNESFIKNEYDLNNIKTNNIKLSTLVHINPDKKKLKKILKNLTSKQIDLIELDDTFKIEMNNKLFYTIFDMEDGNYIAVDKSVSVFRLIHDHKFPVKKIFDNVELLLDDYDGEKYKLNKYFED